MWRMCRCDFTAVSPSDRTQYAHTDLSYITTELWQLLVLYTLALFVLHNHFLPFLSEVLGKNDYETPGGRK